MNFDRRYALCNQKLYDRQHFTVGRSWNKSLHLQPLQRCYCENSGSRASAYVMRRHYSITYMHSLHAINGLPVVGRVGKLLCGRLSYNYPLSIFVIAIIKFNFYRQSFLNDNFLEKNLCHSRDSNHRSLVFRTGALNT